MFIVKTHALETPPHRYCNLCCDKDTGVRSHKRSPCCTSCKIMVTTNAAGGGTRAAWTRPSPFACGVCAEMCCLLPTPPPPPLPPPSSPPPPPPAPALKGTSGFPGSLCLTGRSESPQLFTVRFCGAPSSWVWKPGMGILVWGWAARSFRVTSASEIPSPCSTARHRCGPSLFRVSILLPVLRWPAFYIFG